MTTQDTTDQDTGVPPRSPTTMTRAVCVLVLLATLEVALALIGLQSWSASTIWTVVDVAMYAIGYYLVARRLDDPGDEPRDGDTQ